MSADPPAHVKEAAAVVQGWLDEQGTPGAKVEQQTVKFSAAERLDRARQTDQRSLPEWRDPRPPNQLSPAEKLDRCRQFDQTKMPPWKDPRGTA